VNESGLRTTRILALDASTEALSVAVLDDACTVAFEHFEIAPQAHARLLLPAAQSLLDEAGWQLEDLDGLAFGRGPGAFTGLRIAAGLVQGLAGGLDCPVVPISTLAALAARCMATPEIDHVRVVQDARMGEVYTADFERGTSGPKPVGAERVIEPARVLPWPDTPGWAGAGNGWPLVFAALGQAPRNAGETWPHALDIARLAMPELLAGRGVSAEHALPVYVRDDVARKAADRK